MFAFVCSVTLSGLMPDTRYKIAVIAENGVSPQSDGESSSYIYVTTEAASKLHTFLVMTN